RKYRGSRTGRDLAELTGDGRTLNLRTGLAVVRDASGTELGRLKKTLRRSPTIGTRPPEDATVLFFGRDARQFSRGFVTPDHFLVAGADTRQPYGDFIMHFEFRT